MYSIGFFVSHILYPRVQFLEKIGLAFGSGLGLITFIIFFLSVFHKLSLNSLLLMEVLLLLSLIVFSVKSRDLALLSNARRKFWENSFRSFAANSSWPCIALISILVVSSFIFSGFFPVMELDGYSYLALGRSIAKKYDPYGLRAFTYQKTLLLPLSYTFLDLLKSSLYKIIHPLFYISFLLVFYHRLKDLISQKRPAILLTSLLATTPIIWWHSILSLNNLATSYFFSIAVIILVSEIHKKENLSKSPTLFAGFFFGMAIWTRLEFLFYFIIPLLIVMHFSLKNKQNSLPYYLSVFPLIVGVFWVAYFHSFIAYVDDTSYADVYAIVMIVALLIVFYCVYKFINIYNKSIISIYFFQRIKLFSCSLANVWSAHNIKIALLLFTIFFIGGEYQIIENALPEVNYYLVAAESRFFQTMMQHSYWIFTSCLMLIYFYKRIHLTKEIKYIIFFIISLVVFHNIVYIIVGQGKMFGKGFFEIIKLHLQYPGNFLNGSSSRELISLYPVVIFSVGIVFLNFGLDKTVNIQAERHLYNFIKTIIVLNCLILMLFFYFPRLSFMIKHLGESQREIYLSDGSSDIPNVHKNSNIIAYKIKDITEENSVVIVSSPLDIFSTINILFPRETIWFKSGKNPDSEIYSKYKNKPYYALITKDWRPKVPFRVVKNIKTLDGDNLTLVKIL